MERSSALVCCLEIVCLRISITVHCFEGSQRKGLDCKFVFIKTIFPVWHLLLLYPHRRIRYIIISHSNSGLVLSLLSCLPSIIYALINKSKLPEKCAVHFNLDNIPDGWMSSVAHLKSAIIYRNL